MTDIYRHLSRFLNTSGTRVTLALCLVATALLGGFLWQLKPLVQGPEQTRYHAPSPRIADNTWVGQVFKAARPNLTQIRLLIGTFHLRKFNPTRFELFELAGPATAKGNVDLKGASLIHSRTFSRSRDNRFISFNFPARADSAGRWYLARLSPVKTGLPGSIVLWTNPSAPNGFSLVVNGRIRPGSAVFKTFHQVPGAKTARLWNRLMKEMPTWLSPAAGASAALLGWLAVLFLVQPLGFWGRAAWLAPPLLTAACWAIWFWGLAPHGLEAQYHRGHHLSYPVFERQSHFDLGQPGRRIELRPHLDVHDIREMGLNPKKFSVRYQGRLVAPEAGDYVFELESGGRSKLILNGKTILRAGAGAEAEEPGRNRTVSYLPAGPVDIELIHRQYNGRAWFQTRWGPAGGRLRLLEGVDLLPPGVEPGRFEGLLKFLAASLAWLGALFALIPLGLRLWRDVLVRINRPEIYLPLSLSLIGLLVRLIYVFEAQYSFFGLDAGGYFDFAWDQADYLYLSHGIQKGFWPWLDQLPLASGPAPGFLLAGLASLLGRDIVIMRLAMSLIGLITALVTFSLAKRMFGLGVGWLAMVLIIWSGSGLVHEAAPMIAGPMALVLALTARWCIEVAATGPWLPWARGGLALGLVLLFRGNALLMAPVLGLTLMAVHRWKWPTIQRMTLMAGLAALVLALPTAWNAGLFSDRLTETVIAPSSAGANTLWIGNNPFSEGHNILPLAYLNEIRARQAFKQTTLGRETAAFIFNRPLDWLALMWKKFWMFFNGYEYPNNLDYNNLARTTPILSWGMFNYALLCPLALVGLVFSFGWARLPVRGRKQQLAPLAAIWGGYLVAVVVFFVLGRFRVPLYPILAVFGAFGLKYLFFQPRRYLSWSLLFIVFYLACNWDQFFHPQAHEAAFAWRYWALEYPHFIVK